MNLSRVESGIFRAFVFVFDLPKSTSPLRCYLHYNTFRRGIQVFFGKERGKGRKSAQIIDFFCKIYYTQIYNTESLIGEALMDNSSLNAPLSVDALTKRRNIEVDTNEIVGFIKGRTVLVTGGGGSIGSELCRQIAGYSPALLIIFDIYENNAYELQQQLALEYPAVKTSVLIGSVRDGARIDSLFNEYRPDVVYHAAAHKHVPLMEDSPCEAVKNNVFGTLNLARAADEYGASSFILVSTDKAVNPTNIMGATKRICEMIINDYNAKSSTAYACVRFGNVLGSSGSVIPIFEKQIESGGPVTVTHKDVIRYFMTIPEAVSLLLQAGVYAKDGEVFVLDMGDPVRIDDLARALICRAGLRPDIDIRIEYTGLRPGDKLYEELLLSNETLKKTANEFIFVSKLSPADPQELSDKLGLLREKSAQNSPDIRRYVKNIVPEYEYSKA
ncbi:MAG: polysaccharide biosynthesis protein [Clostridia bacterium]|nr:polysaccharide biosynthesis protein [Clostridia bacterium]